MKRSAQGLNVKISEFKLHLGRFLREVKSGHEVTVLDRETPVARLVPYHEENSLQLEIIAATRNWRETREKWEQKSPSSAATPLKKPSLAYLQEDRDFK